MLISELKVYGLALSSVEEEYIRIFREIFIPNIFPIPGTYLSKESIDRIRVPGLIKQ